MVSQSTLLASWGRILRATLVDAGERTRRGLSLRVTLCSYDVGFPVAVRTPLAGSVPVTYVAAASATTSATPERLYSEDTLSIAWHQIFKM